MEGKNSNHGIDELLLNYLTGMANAEEREEALIWIRDNEEHRKYFDQLKDIYEASKTTQPVSAYNTQLSWEKVKSNYYKRRFTKLETSEKEDRRYFIREISKYAAIILALVAMGVLGFKLMSYKSYQSSMLVWNEVEAPFGSRTVVNLADGSKVWLNAGSKLRYAVNFGQKNREVILTGEGYFDVAKFKNMQFIVKTSHINIKVLGTEFNVKAYPEENTIQTTLVRGAITIEGAKENDKIGKEIYLKPNQSVTFIKNTGVFSQKGAENTTPQTRDLGGNHNLLLLPKVDPIVYTSWKDARWFIEGESMSDLAVKLERRYNVKIEFNTESLKNYKFTGTLRDETLEQVLSLMQYSAPIEFSIVQNTVILKENKSFRKSYDDMLINRK